MLLVVAGCVSIAPASNAWPEPAPPVGSAAVAAPPVAGAVAHERLDRTRHLDDLWLTADDRWTLTTLHLGPGSAGRASVEARLDLTNGTASGNEPRTAAVFVFWDGHLAAFAATGALRPVVVWVAADTPGVRLDEAIDAAEPNGQAIVRWTVNVTALVAARGTTTVDLLASTRTGGALGVHGVAGTVTDAKVTTKAGNGVQAIGSAGFDRAGTAGHGRAQAGYPAAFPNYVEASVGFGLSRAVIAPCGLTGVFIGPWGTSAGTSSVRATNNEGFVAEQAVFRAGTVRSQRDLGGGEPSGVAIRLAGAATQWRFDVHESVSVGLHENLLLHTIPVTPQTVHEPSEACTAFLRAT